MAKVKSDTLHVQGINVGIYTEDYRNEYISLTDIARYRNSDDPRFAIQNWMRNRNTIEFLGLWETLHNPNFKRVELHTVKVGVVETLPKTKKLNGVAVAHPVLYGETGVVAVTIAGDVGQRDILVAVVLGVDANIYAFHMQNVAFNLAHNIRCLFGFGCKCTTFFAISYRFGR